MASESFDFDDWPQFRLSRNRNQATALTRCLDISMTAPFIRVQVRFVIFELCSFGRTCSLSCRTVLIGRLSLDNKGPKTDLSANVPHGNSPTHPSSLLLLDGNSLGERCASLLLVYDISTLRPEESSVLHQSRVLTLSHVVEVQCRW